MSERFFPAKLLLFGEHILLRGAQALAVPTPGFGGQWSNVETPKAPQSRGWFREGYAQFGRDLPLDFESMERDIDQGWYFHSNIPHGYGMGSSGAFCAGVWSRYGVAPAGIDLAQLKRQLAEMESSFHGRSSGIDPLTSFLARPLLVNGDQVADLSEQYHPPGSVTVFLIDTRQSRQTGRLVQWFIQRCAAPDFLSALENDLFPLHTTLLESWIRGDGVVFMDRLAEVSQWQWTHLPPMMPASEAVGQWWQQALEGSDTRLKICGAGGGGFVLGFTFERLKVEATARDLGLEIVFPFDVPHDATV